ncbi:sensor histidine kinase [Desulfonema magnum]|uniref:Sensory/regulatory protein RpfC n=1 Tax=Desulfonema magnum TaxID=45655 RepID=A0A975GK07_9BACT|nr:ATP-binding protein [Desulfonema magnum]QTA84102.1 Two component system histidine kinase [Desulfonema magnum]
MQLSDSLREQSECKIKSLEVRYNPSGEEIFFSREDELDQATRTFACLPGYPSNQFWYFSDERQEMKKQLSQLRTTNKKLKEAKEAAEAVAKAKSEFLAFMSHEIKNPMSAIISMTNFLMKTELTAQQYRFADIIREGGENLLRIVNDILDFSKIESGKMALEANRFELMTCLRNVYDLLVLKASEKNIELTFLIEPSVPRFINSDVIRLNQILFNLVENALKFTEQGEVSVGVKKISENNGMVELQFSVKDTGIGIPSDKRECLFQSFSQIDVSTMKKYGGTGLGLAICSHLVKLMGGKIWLESSAGKGSTFFFTIFTTAAQETVAKKYPLAA